MYPFIYNDPWQWRLIYEANKSQLPQPDNPDIRKQN
jgi:nucleoid-associated protein YgaU